MLLPHSDGTGGDNSQASPTLLLVVVLATLGAVGYLLFIFNPAHAGDVLPYGIVLLAETIIVIEALLAVWTIMSGGLNPRHYGYHDAQEKLLMKGSVSKRYHEVEQWTPEKQTKLVPHLRGQPVTIDVFITVFGENPNTVQETVLAAKNIVGRHRTTVLDDGHSERIQHLATDLEVDYIARASNEHAKAGNINSGLAYSDAEFFIIFDADFVAQPNFLYETVPFFEDSRVAFVQTPQCYRNTNNIISRGANYMQSLFYKYIMPGKNRFNSAFCVGTNVVFRRSAINEIGGIYEQSKSEDIWTSMLLHERGWKSVYLTDQLAIGQTPDTIESYSKQQLRWSTGGMEILLKRNPLFNRGLTIDQKLQYFSTSAYYLHGFAIMLLLLVPPLHIFFNLSPVDISTELINWVLVYLGFYGLQIVLAFYAMQGFRWETLLLSVVSFPIYIKSLFNVLIGKDHSWNVTGRLRTYNSPFNYIIPQFLIFIFLVFTTVVGVLKAYYYETVSVSLFWAAINTLIFGIFLRIASKESRRLRRAARQERKERAIAQRTGALEGSTNL